MLYSLKQKNLYKYILDFVKSHKGSNIYLILTILKI